MVKGESNEKKQVNSRIKESKKGLKEEKRQQCDHL